MCQPFLLTHCSTCFCHFILSTYFLLPLYSWFNLLMIFCCFIGFCGSLCFLFCKLSQSFLKKFFGWVECLFSPHISGFRHIINKYLLDSLIFACIRHSKHNRIKILSLYIFQFSCTSHFSFLFNNTALPTRCLEI